MQPQTTAPPSPLMQRLVKLLGLAPDADEETLLAALEEALKDRTKPDPKDYMPVAAVTAMMRERSVERLAHEEGRAIEKVNAALRQGYISPAMKDWALALCRSDGAAFDTFLAASGPTFSYLFKPMGLEGPPPATLTRRESDTEAAICAQLGLKPGSLKD